MELVDGRGINIWVYEWQRDTMSRLTLGGGGSPVWTPDGLRIAFVSANGGIYWQRADGAGEVQRLTESNNGQFPKSWHPSGKFLAFEEYHPATGALYIMILPMEGSETAGWKPGKPFAFLNSPSNERWPMFSSDGRWLAYSSEESGTMQVYVRPFPGPGGKWQISTNGGYYPTWSSNGKELFYQDEGGKIMVVGYTASGSAFQAEKPRVWSPVSVPLSDYNRSMDVGPDGKRLAVVLPAPEAQAAAKGDHITFFFNFTDELRRIAPPARK